MNPYRKKRTWDEVFIDFIVTIGILVVTILLCTIIHREDKGGSTAAIMIFTLSVLYIARITTGYIWGIIASFVGVIVVNYIFTYPYFELNFTLEGYPLTFLTMLIVSVITSASSTGAKYQDYLRAENEKEKLRSGLLRSVSHDIRTPLTSIVGSTSAILDDENKLTREQKKQLLQDVHDDGEWLIRVTENILSITRFSDDHAVITKTPELAEELIETSVRKFIKRHPDSLPVNVRLPEEPVFIPMDIMLMEQVLTNLLENALIHGIGATEIILTVKQDDDHAYISVEDDGVAIPKDILPTLFDTSIKSDTHLNNNGTRCMGIGLSVCHAIVNAHDGTITAENLPENSGVVFTIKLPVEKEELYEN